MRPNTKPCPSLELNRARNAEAELARQPTEVPYRKPKTFGANCVSKAAIATENLKQHRLAPGQPTLAPFTSPAVRSTVAIDANTNQGVVSQGLWFSTGDGYAYDKGSAGLTHPGLPQQYTPANSPKRGGKSSRRPETREPFATPLVAADLGPPRTLRSRDEKQKAFEAFFARGGSSISPSVGAAGREMAVEGPVVAQPSFIAQPSIKAEYAIKTLPIPKTKLPGVVKSPIKTEPKCNAKQDDFEELIHPKLKRCDSISSVSSLALDDADGFVLVEAFGANTTIEERKMKSLEATFSFLNTQQQASFGDANDATNALSLSTELGKIQNSAAVNGDGVSAGEKDAVKLAGAQGSLRKASSATTKVVGSSFRLAATVGSAALSIPQYLQSRGQAKSTVSETTRPIDDNGILLDDSDSDLYSRPEPKSLGSRAIKMPVRK